MILLDSQECSHLMNILIDYKQRVDSPLESTLFVHNGKEIFTADVFDKLARGALDGGYLRPKNDSRSTEN